MRPFKYGLVDNINPVLEDIFQLLGQRTSIRQLKIVFKICDEYPGQGSIVEDGFQCPEDGWHSMDLPNLVEKLRTIYAYKPGIPDIEPSFDVSWIGDCRPLIWRKPGETISRVVISDHLQNIEDHGWEIDIRPPLKEDASEWTPHDESAVISIYTLRKKKLEEPLMGDHPNPYSGIFIRPGSEEAAMEEVTGWYS